MKKATLIFSCLVAAAGLTSCGPATTVSPAAPEAHIPILAWGSVTNAENWKYATKEHYQELRDAGFDYTYTWASNYDDAVHVLDMAAQVGMKAIFMCPKLKEAPEETVGKLKDHPGLGGWYLKDEPWDNELEELGAWARRVESVDTLHPCYINLLPSYCFTPEGYEKHLRLFSEKVALPQISFDHYPVGELGGKVVIWSTWYQNLELVRAEARRTHKPFWAFALATAHTNPGLHVYVHPTPTEEDPAYPIPTIDQLRVQMYSNLAYGAQLLQYFTYWNPDTVEHHALGFHEAPITMDGRRTPVYDLVRQMNEEIQRRAFVWAGCDVEDVAHLAEGDIPVGTKPLTVLPPHIRTLANVSGQGLVSTIRNGAHRYVMLVNTSPAEPWYVNVTTDDGVQIISSDGTSTPANRYDKLHILSPGNCEVYEVE